MALVPTNESKDTLKKYEEIRNKIRDLISLIPNYSDDNDKKYIKDKNYSGDGLPQNRTLKLWNMVIVVRSVFHESKKYYSHISLDKCLHKLRVIQKCFIMIELTFLEALMLIRQVDEKSAPFVTIAVF